MHSKLPLQRSAPSMQCATKHTSLVYCERVGSQGGSGWSKGKDARGGLWTTQQRGEVGIQPAATRVRTGISPVKRSAIVGK